MLPTVATVAPSAIPPARPRRVLTLGALDSALFDDAGWFAIDATNRRVPGVVIPTLDAGLALVGQGSIATIVGRLREHLAVVDIDVNDERGHDIAQSIATWCQEHGLWNLVRPSGGAHGRHHVFVAVQEHRAHLNEFATALRGRHHLSASAIDVRVAVRPLSAPHRTGVATKPAGDLHAALRRLPTAHRASSATRLTAGTATSSKLAPRPRRRTNLPPAWATYLQTGDRPLIGGSDTENRSTYEAIATAWLLRCGHDADSAWSVIAQSHERAMGKAQEQGKSWWVRYVWNLAVRDDQEFRPEPRTEPAIIAAVQEARERLQHHQWAIPQRRRATFLLVGHHLLDRMERSNQLRVPCAERDLVLDTGVKDRSSIRRVLREFDAVLGALDTSTLDPARRDSTSFEFEIPRASGVRQNNPPSLHTPHPRGLPPGLWSALPRSCHALWRQLLHQQQSQTLAELCVSAGVVTSNGDIPSVSHLRTARSGLAALAAVGMALCRADGRWEVRDALDPEFVHQHVSTRHAAALALITTERRSYRAGTVSLWRTEQAVVLKANKAREQAWWDSLDPVERVKRRDQFASRYAQLPVNLQEELKTRLADVRQRAGIDERARHDSWVDAQRPCEFDRRVIDRTAWFARLASPLQQAHVQAWERHRGRYNVPRGTPRTSTRREHEEMLPTTGNTRDEAFIGVQVHLPVPVPWPDLYAVNV